MILFPFKTSCQTTCHVFSRYNRGRECFGFWYGVSSHTSLNFSTQKRVCFFACVLETPETCSYLLLCSQIPNFQKPVRVGFFLLAFSKLPETCSYLRLRSWIETQKRVRVGFFACVLETPNARAARVPYHAVPFSFLEQKIDVRNVDLKKMRVKQLRKILQSWDEECTGCIEKNDFVQRIEELKDKHTEL